MDKKYFKYICALMLAILVVIFMTSCLNDSMPQQNDDSVSEMKIELHSDQKYPSGKIKVNLVSKESNEEYGLTFKSSNGYKKTVCMPEGQYYIKSIELEDVGSAGVIYDYVSGFGEEPVQVIASSVWLSYGKSNVINIMFFAKMLTFKDMVIRSSVILVLAVAVCIVLIVLKISKKKYGTNRPKVEK